MKKVIALIVAAVALSACSTVPSAPRTAGEYCKVQARTAGEYCKVQARIAAARAGMADFNPMAGQNTDVEQQVYADCVSKVAAK